MESLGAQVAADPAWADGGDPLALSPAQMRTIGYRTIDLLVERLSDPDMLAMRRASRAELSELIEPDVPERPQPWTQLIDRLDDSVLTFMSRLAHPSYFAFIPASCTFPGALGDLITSALDIDAGSWSSAGGPSHLELVVLDWFKQWIGYPEHAGGALVSGGSAANVTALACAREALVGAGCDRGVIYTSQETHSSVLRAARLLGFRAEQVRRLPSDERYRLSTGELIAAMDCDRAAGARPLIVAANAGTTNTGAIDPLPELAAICRERGMWLHVDAAYGGFAALTDRGRRLLRGLELADSVTLDPHKWLYQPIECGCVLVREPGLLEQAFAIAPDYLADYRGAEVDFCDRGLQLTRSARALKVWLSLSYFGAAAFREAIDRALDLARLAERLVREHPTLELLCPATLGVICFRRRLGSLRDEEQLEQLNAELVARFEASGRGLVSSTRLHGRYAVRMCVMNHTTSRADVERALGWLASQPVMIEGRASAAGTRAGQQGARAGQQVAAAAVL